MSKIQKYLELIRENNVLSGIIIIDFLSIIFFIVEIFVVGVPGVLSINIAVIIGMIFLYRNRKPTQNPFYIGFTTGPLGALIASISITIMVNFGGLNIGLDYFFTLIALAEIFTVAITAAFSILFNYFDKKRGEIYVQRDM